MATRNPRRIALEILRSIKSNAGVMVSVWDQDQTTYDKIAREWRKLLPEEKNENKSWQWDRLAQFMDVVIEEATALRDYADDQMKKTLR